MVGVLQGRQRWRQRIAKEIEAVKNLIYLGEQTQDEVNALLAGADIFVNTSRWEGEGFPNTLIQAWQRKVPVVSLLLNPDGIFEDKRVGFYSGSYQKFHDDVLELIRNPTLRQNIGNKAQAHALVKHSEKNIEKLLAVFDD